MFERYNEKARRMIFFARYEASQRSSGYIELEDLALAALREDSLLISALSPGQLGLLKDQLRNTPPSLHRPTATSVDLPLNNASKRALSSGAEEAERQGRKTITPGHLVIGVLLQRESPAAAALEAVGLGLDRVRELLGQEPAGRQPLLASRRPKVMSPSLSPLVDALYASLSTPLKDTSEASSGLQETRKRSLGHLIDLAIANQHWIAGALAQGELHAINIPGEAWVEVQKYVDDDWTEMVDLWLHVNRHLLNVMASIPEDKLSIPCRIAGAEPVSLEELIASYVQAVSEWLRRMTHPQA